MRQPWVQVLPLLFVNFSLVSFSTCKTKIQHYLLKELLTGINERSHAKHKLIVSIGLWLNSRGGLVSPKQLKLEWIPTTMVWYHSSVSKIYSDSFLFWSLPLFPCGSCKVPSIIELNLLFPCINQSFHIRNFISLWEDCFPDRELLGTLMREKNILNSPFDSSPSLSPPSSLQLLNPVNSASTMWVLRTLVVSSTCNCPYWLSLNDCNCHMMGLLVSSYSLLLLPYSPRQLTFLHHQFTWSPMKTLFLKE